MDKIAKMAGNARSAPAQVRQERHSSEDPQDEAEDSDIDINMGDDAASSGSDTAKSDTEMELEKLVFGDSAGFRSGISTFQEDRLDQDPLEDDEDQDALATVDDTDLFFLDAAPDTFTDMRPEIETALVPRQPPAAWEDSDDERMMVSLTSVPRLKKLREYDGEDVVSGREYIRRLRRQYEVLNPTPKWATYSSTVSRHKRRRLSGDSDASDASVSASQEKGDDDGDDDDIDDDAPTSTRPLAALLRSAEMLTSSSSTSAAKSRLRLRPEVLSIQRLPDIGPVQLSPITCISIHPTLPLLLSSGNPSGLLHLHHILPHPIPPLPANPLVTSLHLKHTPLATTAFGPSEAAPRIYMSARRRYFHSWDLVSGDISKVSRVYGQGEVQRSMERLKPSPCGRYVAIAGSSSRGAHLVNVLDAATLQWAAQAALDAPGGLAEFVWWRDGEGLLLVGKGGEVAEWSLRARAVVARWQDEGGVAITTAALGGQLPNLRRGAPTPVGTDRWVAIGSASGFVNVYDRAAWREAAADADSDFTYLPPPAPRPVKVLENLTTPVSCLAFSPDGQLLCMSSRWKRDALRLVHLPSATVYRNWPTGKTPLGRVSAVALGEHVERGGAAEGERSVLLVVGNEAGALRMWEIRA